MYPAPINRMAALMMALCLLVACSAKQPAPPAPASALSTNLEGHAPSWPISGGRDDARPSHRQDRSAPVIAPEAAGQYIGQTVTVCGTVASTKYSVRTKGQPTFLNLDRPYPNQIFTVTIWGHDRPKFSEPPEVFYQGANISVTGRITNFRGAPEIVVHAPSQIAVNK